MIKAIEIKQFSFILCRKFVENILKLFRVLKKKTSNTQSKNMPSVLGNWGILTLIIMFLQLFKNMLK